VGKEAVILPKANRKNPRPYDKALHHGYGRNWVTTV
jgi:hypothetical protein